MEGLGRSRRGQGSEDFGSLFESPLREQAQQKLEVEGGALDISRYTDEQLDIENGEVNFDTYAGNDDQAYTVPYLKIGTKLRNVFIAPFNLEPETNKLPLKVNGRNVRFSGYASVPEDADYQDLVVEGVTESDIFVGYLGEESSSEERLESFENKAFEVRDIVRDVVFKSEGTRLIASNPDGKAFILDTDKYFPYDALDGAAVDIRIIRDTKPGNRDGFYVVEFVTPEEAAQAASPTEKLPVDEEVRDFVVSIPELEKPRGNIRSFDDDGDIQNFEVSGLKEGTVLTNVFLTNRDPLDIFNQQSFRLNDKSVYVEDTESFEEGRYDVQVVRNNPEDTYIDVEIVSKKQSIENPDADNEKSDLIRGRFNQTDDGRFIANTPGGKALLLDTTKYFPSNIVSRGLVPVKVLRDTKPGSRDGFLVVAFDEDSEPDRRVLRDGKVNFEGVYTPGKERCNG
jgi:hypothetical protein